MFLQLTLLSFLSSPDDQEVAFPLLLSALNDEVTGPLIRKFIKTLVVRGRATLHLQHNPTALRLNSFCHEMDKILLQPATTTKAFAVGRRAVMIPEHYYRRHRIQLQWPEFPCLIALGGLVKKAYPTFSHEDVFPLELLLIRFDGDRSQIEDFMSRYAYRWAPPKIHPFNHLLVDSRPSTPSEEGPFLIEDDDWVSACSEPVSDTPLKKNLEIQAEPSTFNITKFVPQYSKQTKHKHNLFSNPAKLVPCSIAPSTTHDWGSAPNNASALTHNVPATRSMETQTEPSVPAPTHLNKLVKLIPKLNTNHSYINRPATSRYRVNDGWGSDDPVRYFPTPSFANSKGFGTPSPVQRGGFGYKLRRGEVSNGKYLRK